MGKWSGAPAGLLLMLLGGVGAFLDAETRNALLFGRRLQGPVDFTKIVQCDGEERPFDVPLVPELAEINSTMLQPPSTPFIPLKITTWTPEQPNIFQLPPGLDCINTNFEVLQDLTKYHLQEINRNLQSLSENTSTINPEWPVRQDIRQLCDDMSDDRLDSDNQFFIVDTTIIGTINMSDVMDIKLSPSRINANRNRRSQMEFLFEAMRCDPLYMFVDLGATYLPRYMVAGSCVRRPCSFPIAGGQICRADLSNIARLPGLRYECCWSGRNNRDRVFDCGWRRVNIPVLCDCDCDCPPRDVSTG